MRDAWFAATSCCAAFAPSASQFFCQGLTSIGDSSLLADGVPPEVANQLTYLAEDVIDAELNMAVEKLVVACQDLACLMQRSHSKMLTCRTLTLCCCIGCHGARCSALASNSVGISARKLLPATLYLIRFSLASPSLIAQSWVVYAAGHDVWEDDFEQKPSGIFRRPAASCASAIACVSAAGSGGSSGSGSDRERQQERDKADTERRSARARGRARPA